MQKYMHVHVCMDRDAQTWHMHAHIGTEKHSDTHTCTHAPRSCLTQAVASPPPGPAPKGHPAPAGGVLPAQWHLQSTLLPLLWEESAGRCVTFHLTTATGSSQI